MIYFGDFGGGGDPSFADVVLLMGANGSNGSTSFIDESAYARTLTANGNAQVSTSNKQFGTGSLLCDGSGDYVMATADAALRMSNSAYTYECWVRFNSTLNNQYIMGMWDGSFAVAGFRLFLNAGNLTFQMSTGGGNPGPSGAFAPTLGNWYFIAAERKKGTPDTMYLYAGPAGGSASLIGSANINSIEAMPATTNNLRIGMVAAFGSFNGNIDEVRITKGVARYNGTAGFPVPVAEFPRI